MVQEYGRYFGMPTCCLRGGCLTGPSHSGVELHGFLSYLVKCNLEGREYRVFGYKGKQVRDNIHSRDVARFIHAFIEAPRVGEVYNLGGGKGNSVSILEAFELVERLTGKPQRSTYVEQDARRRSHLLLQRPAEDARTLSRLGHHAVARSDSAADGGVVDGAGRRLSLDGNPGDELRREYERRFSARAEYRAGVWRILTDRVFQAYVPDRGTVLELGCGWGEFINQIRAGRRIGMDLNPDSAARLAAGVEFLHQDCSQPWPLADGTLDAVFTSNFFEHLPDKASLARTLRQTFRCLKPGGRLICLGPNIRFLHGRYWDFWDHYVPLTDISLVEVHGADGIHDRARGRALPAVYDVWRTDAPALDAADVSAAAVCLVDLRKAVPRDRTKTVTPRCAF